MNILTGALLLLAALAVRADEGMWTFHDFPAALVQDRHGVQITSDWLDRVRTSTVRLSNCTASFVSPAGLILTNHHCAWACLAENSSKEQNYLEQGFMSSSREKELRCRTQVADILMEVENITAKVAAATRGLDSQAASDKRKKTLTELEQRCDRTRGKGLRCESVTLYNGGQYWLYKYRRYNDVRIAFAPEKSIGAFGGDPDNFQFPRWCLDMTLMRAYDKAGKPVTPPNYLQIDFNGPDPREPVFVAGHPGSTSRLLTVSQLLTLRDIDMPQWLLRASELRGRYLQFAKQGAEQARIVEAPLSNLENSIKVRRKLLDALHDDRMLAQKREEESRLRSAVSDGNDPWAQIERAQQARRALSLSYTFLEGAAGFNSELFRHARTLIRASQERTKPNNDRLREYRDTALPRTEQQLAAALPVYPELEKLTLSFSLERMREWLGPDHPVVRELLSEQSPDGLAERLVNGSKLADPALRMQLWKGGASAVQASEDPMIKVAQSVDAAARAVRKRYEDEVEAPIDAASEQIAQLRFATYGTRVAPDATFTLRLNFGTVQGWTENGEVIPPFTYLNGLFERSTGQEPFLLPERWQELKYKLDMKTKFNLATNNDIVGGNSGSPLVNAKGRIVGLIFDGNIHSIAGAYSFNPELNRAVAVHPAIIREALTKVYDAQVLLTEMGAQP